MPLVRRIPPELEAKKPKPMWCIAMDRESGRIHVFGTLQPSLEPFFVFGKPRKHTPEWWRAHFWRHEGAWQMEKEVMKHPYWKNYREILADTKEEAISEYKSEIRNQRRTNSECNSGGACGESATGEEGRPGP